MAESVATDLFSDVHVKIDDTSHLTPYVKPYHLSPDEVKALEKLALKGRQNKGLVKADQTKFEKLAYKHLSHYHEVVLHNTHNRAAAHAERASLLMVYARELEEENTALKENADRLSDMMQKQINDVVRERDDLDIEVQALKGTNSMLTKALAQGQMNPSAPSFTPPPSSQQQGSNNPFSQPTMQHFSQQSTPPFNQTTPRNYSQQSAPLANGPQAFPMNNPFFKFAAPKITKKFTGGEEEWNEFWPKFCMLYHNQNMDNSLKMTYLRENVEGKAKATIDQYPVDGSQYENAVAALKEKHASVARLVRHYTLKVTDIARATDTESLQKLYNEVMQASIQLTSLGTDANALVTTVERKLASKYTHEIIRAAGKSIALMKMDELLGWIKKELVLYNEQPADEEQEVNAVSSLAATAGRTNQGRAKAPCVYCKSTEHTTFFCMKVVDPKERLKVVLKNRLCYNCLKTGHGAMGCPMSNNRCRTCRDCHHTSLHDALVSSDQKQKSN